MGRLTLSPCPQFNNQIKEVMNVKELNRDQLIQLKQRYLVDWYDSVGQSPSYGELADADNLVSDETVLGYFDGVEFVEEDFPLEKKC
jgi:hypothetical protein